MLPDLPVVVIAVALGAALAAGLARGFSGFGAALVFVPVASAALGPKLAVPVLLVVDGIMALPLLPPAVRRCQWPDVLAMTAGAFVGIPIGAWVLAHADATAIRWGISVLIFCLLAVLASGWRFRDRPAAPLTAGVGVASGLLSGVAQVGGPPVVVYWLGGVIPAATVRANLIAYFGISTVLSVAAYVTGGLLTDNVLRLALLAAPIYGAGLWLGAHMFGLASETLFRRACYGLIALSALTGLPVLDRLWH